MGMQAIFKVFLSFNDRVMRFPYATEYKYPIGGIMGIVALSKSKALGIYPGHGMHHRRGLD
jgi:hypothetical protein